MTSFFRTLLTLSFLIHICGAIAHIDNNKTSHLSRQPTHVLQSSIHKDHIRGTAQYVRKSIIRTTEEEKRTENHLPEAPDKSRVALPEEFNSHATVPKQVPLISPYKAILPELDSANSSGQCSEAFLNRDKEKYQQLTKKCEAFLHSDLIKSIRVHDQHCSHWYSISISEVTHNSSLATIYTLKGHPSIETVTAISTTQTLAGTSKEKTGISKTYNFLSLQKLIFTLHNQTKRQVTFDIRKNKRIDQTVLLMVYSPRYLSRNFFPQLTQPKYRKADKQARGQNKSAPSTLDLALYEAEALVANGQLVKYTPLCQRIMLNPLSPDLLDVILAMDEHEITEAQFFTNINRHANRFYPFDFQTSFYEESISFWDSIRTHFTPAHYFIRHREVINTIIKLREDALSAVQSRKQTFIQESKILEDSISPSLQFTIDKVTGEVSTMVVDTFDKFSFAITVKHHESHVYPYSINTLL